MAQRALEGGRVLTADDVTLLRPASVDGGEAQLPAIAPALNSALEHALALDAGVRRLHDARRLLDGARLLDRRWRRLLANLGGDCAHRLPGTVVDQLSR